MARVRVQIPEEEAVATATAQSPEPEVAHQSAPAIQEDHASIAQAAYALRPPLLTKKRLILAVSLVGLVIIIFALAALLNDRNHLRQQVKQATTQASTPANDALKYQEEIGKIVELPSGQTPSLVAVKDVKTLATENPFFKNGADGDVVLLYVLPDKSVRAILYRPSTHKVIEATSSATVGGGSTTAPPSATKSKQ